MKVQQDTQRTWQSHINHFKALGQDKGYSPSAMTSIPGRSTKIIADCKDADVFINNAWSEYYGQTKCLRYYCLLGR